MIIESRKKEPFISFGFNQIEKTVKVGEIAKIYIDEIYNDDLEYNIDIFGAKYVNNNEFDVVTTSEGSFSFKAELTSRINQKLESNTIKLNVT